MYISNVWRRFEFNAHLNSVFLVLRAMFIYLVVMHLKLMKWTFEFTLYNISSQMNTFARLILIRRNDMTVSNYWHESRQTLLNVKHVFNTSLTHVNCKQDARVSDRITPVSCGLVLTVPLSAIMCVIKAWMSRHKLWECLLWTNFRLH